MSFGSIPVSKHRTTLQQCCFTMSYQHLNNVVLTSYTEFVLIIAHEGGQFKINFTKVFRSLNKIARTKRG